MSSIYDRIKIVRKTARLTQQEFAEKLGLKQNTIATYEMGKTSPSERTLSDICRVFNVDPCWLETGEGEMFRAESADAELTRLVGELMADKPGSFRQRVITALLRCTDDEWGVFRRVLGEIEKDAEP